VESRSRMKVPDVRKNLVPNAWTTDGEGALPELGPCPHDNSCGKAKRQMYWYTVCHVFYIHRLLWIVVSAMLWPYQSCSCHTVDNLAYCCALSE